MARRHTPEQVIAKVRQGQKMLNDGHPMIEVVKELQVTEATWYRWLNQYGSEKNAEASKRTKELEKENARLKRLLAEVIEKDAAMKRKLVAAYLIGTNVAVPPGADVGGDFKTIKLQYNVQAKFVLE